jgi:hypothetical protein
MTREMLNEILSILDEQRGKKYTDSYIDKLKETTIQLYNADDPHFLDPTKSPTDNTIMYLTMIRSAMRCSSVLFNGDILNCLEFKYPWMANGENVDFSMLIVTAVENLSRYIYFYKPNMHNRMKNILLVHLFSNPNNKAMLIKPYMNIRKPTIDLICTYELSVYMKNNCEGFHIKIMFETQKSIEELSDFRFLVITTPDNNVLYIHRFLESMDTILTKSDTDNDKYVSMDLCIGVKEFKEGRIYDKENV